MENNNSKIAVAIIAGIAAGAATWYFMTTENGRHNWSTLIDLAKDVSDKLMTAGAEKGSAFVSAGREASEYAGQKASEAFDSVKNYQ